MFVLVWEFEVEPGREPEFERAYGPAGDWVHFFSTGAGYVGTDLLRGSEPGRYLTIDRWNTPEAYAAFRSARLADYEALDGSFTPLTVNERSLGSFEVVSG